MGMAVTLEDVKKKLAAFESGFTPIAPGEATQKKTKETLPSPQPEVPTKIAEPGQACFNKCFIELIKSVPKSFIGNDMEELVYMMLEQAPTCGNSVKVGVAS
jgi:hypothetical protein